MVLSEGVKYQTIEIWQPRWHDRTVLIDVKKVGAHNKIVFTKAPTLTGEWYISGRDIHQCNIGSNGKIPVYVVPLRFLEPLEHKPHSAKQRKLL